MDPESHLAGPPGYGARILVGTGSWTNPGLVGQTAWYPRRSMSSAERLDFYARHFGVVLVGSTHFFPPDPEQSRRWVAATPARFRFDVSAYSLLTGSPTLPQSLWGDLAEAVMVRHRGKRRLYPTHLDPDALDEVWSRFVHGLRPLHDAGRLGAVVMRFPRWFGPSPANLDVVADLPRRLEGLAGAVEFRHRRWTAGEQCETTLSLLEEAGLSHVCADTPQGLESSVPPVLATTADLALVRFHGRNPTSWERPAATGTPTVAYRYRVGELAEWVPRIGSLAGAAGEVHAIMDNSWRDDAVVNASQLTDLLHGRDPRPDDAGPPPPRWSQLRLAL